MRPLHLVAGALAVVAFVHSGLVMRSTFPEAYAGHEIVRYLYRANHIYILLAGLLHLLAGVYLVREDVRWRRVAQLAGSTLLVAATVALVAAFHFEPKTGPHRPVTAAGVVGMVAGTAAHLLARARRRRNPPT